MIIDAIFYVLAAATLLSALAVVSCRNIFHSAIALSACLSIVAALFALLGADFLAASQLLVYVGGIMILMLFVIMLSQRPATVPLQRANSQWFWGLLLSGVIAWRLLLSFRQVFRFEGSRTPPVPTTIALGHLLMSDMLVPFEAISLVLLAALVGAVLFGQDLAENPPK